MIETMYLDIKLFGHTTGKVKKLAQRIQREKVSRAMDEDIFDPEEEYFSTIPPVIQEYENKQAKIDGRSKAARLAKKAQGRTNGHRHELPGMVTLNQDQLSKLWQVITGGRIVIDESAGRIVAHVSLDSFEKALPILLERL
jgi:hypothetical protein